MTLLSKKQVVLLTGSLLLLALAAFITHRVWDQAWAHTVQQILLVLSSVIAGAPIAQRAVAALRYRTFSIDLLVTIAVVGALLIGEFVESAVVSFLFLFGDWLEARSLERTRQSVRDLVNAAPTTARRRLSDGSGEEAVPVDEIELGDMLLARSGDRVPVDGTIVEGLGHLNEASITGEPLPVEKTTDEQVFAGTTLNNGYLLVEATSVGDDTTFARIIELVEDAQDAKAPRQRFLDRFAAIYTPAVIVAAALFGLITWDIRLALTFLVIACPGALVIATPMAMVAGLGNGAAQGVIIKGGDAMERLAKIDTIVVDKTGTLTEGSPRLTGVHPVSEHHQGTALSHTELLRLAASAELGSEHPLATALVTAARDQNLDIRQPTDVEVERGVGVHAVIDDVPVSVVSDRGLSDGMVPAADYAAARSAEDSGATVSWVMVHGQVVGFVTMADELREGVAESVRALHRGGVDQMVMLTGDNPRAATAIAERAGIDQVHAQLLPDDKVSHVQQLTAQGATTAMVGDGLNDAPALAAADVGVAMGAGTDVSVETADVVLAGNRLDQLVHAHRLSRQTVRIMTQNTVIALGTVFILILGVVFSVVNMSIGMLVHEASVLLVILNALRLARWSPHDL